MTLSVAPPPDCSPTFAPRQRDRRLGIGDLLAMVSQGVEEGADVAALRSSFESMVRRLAPVRSATLRDGQGRSLRNEAAEGSQALALEVPGADAATRGVLEVRFDPPSGLADWDLQVLHQAAHVAALVLEIERGRSHARTAHGRPGRDGARPLVGNTPAMQSLCATIDRVAATDFTVLLEGPSDPQQNGRSRANQPFVRGSGVSFRQSLGSTAGRSGADAAPYAHAARPAEIPSGFAPASLSAARRDPQAAAAPTRA
jgi:hypothetical protein